MARRTRSSQAEPRASLTDPSEAAASLNTALDTQEEGREQAFLLTLRQVAETYGMAKLAEEAKLSRESLYRTLSAQGNPRLSTVIVLLDVLGLRLKIAPKAAREEQPSPPPLQHFSELLPFVPSSFSLRTPAKSKVMNVRLWLTVERNSKFVRGKKRAREDIEYYVLRHYDMKKRWPDGNEYELTIPYDTDEELDDIIYRDILQEASSQADLRNCFIEATCVRSMTRTGRGSSRDVSSMSFSLTPFLKAIG